MKFAKALIAALTLFASSAEVMAVTTYTDDFQAPPNYPGTPGAPFFYTDGDNLAGQRGWVINDTPNTQLSFFTDFSGSTWAALGGRFSTPDVSANVALTHSSALPLSHAPTFDVDFSLVESDSVVGPNLDAFSWNLKSATNTDLVRIAFEPNSASSTVGQRQIVIYAPGAAPVVTGLDIVAGTKYHLSLVFASAGANGLFTGAITPGVGLAYNFGGVIPGEGSASVGQFGLDWDLSDPTLANAGSNHLLFDNIAAVPEPSSSVVAGLSLLSLIARRRRK